MTSLMSTEAARIFCSYLHQCEGISVRSGEDAWENANSQVLSLYLGAPGKQQECGGPYDVAEPFEEQLVHMQRVPP